MTLPFLLSVHRDAGFRQRCLEVCWYVLQTPMPTCTAVQHLTVVAAICSALISRGSMCHLELAFWPGTQPPMQCPFSRLLFPPDRLALARALAPLTLPPHTGSWAGGGGNKALRGGDPSLESAGKGLCQGGGEGQGDPGDGRAWAARLRGDEEEDEEEEALVCCSCRGALGAGGATAASWPLQWLPWKRAGVPVPRLYSSRTMLSHKPIVLSTSANFCCPCH